MIIDSYCGSFPHSLLSTSKIFKAHLVGGLEHEFYIFPYIGKNTPN